MNNALTKEISFNFTRRISGEKMAFGFLALWCALPLVIAVATLIIAISGGFAFADEAFVNGPVFILAHGVYRRLFFVLGSATIVFALSQIVICRTSLFNRESLRSYPWVYLLATMLVWAVISTALSDDPEQGFKGSYSWCDGLYGYFIYAAIFCCALRIHDDSLKLKTCTMFVATASILSIIMIGQAAHAPIIYQSFEAPFAAVFNNLNHFGYILCISSLCSMGLLLHSESKCTRIVYLTLFTLQIFTLLLNNTFGSYLGVVGGICVYYVIWKRRGHAFNLFALSPLAIFLTLNALSLLGIFGPIENGNVGRNFLQLGSDLVAVGTDAPNAGAAGSGRMRLWIASLAMIPERPIFGYGPEEFINEVSLVYGYTHPHNEFIQHAVFLGIPALMLYLAAICTLAVHQWRTIKKLSPVAVIASVAVIGYLISSFFGNTMFYTTPYFWMLYGFATCQSNMAQALFIPDSITYKDSSSNRISRFANAAMIGIAAFLAILACTTALFL